MLQALSAFGRCRTMDSLADGYGFAVGAFASTISSKDVIFGIVASSNVNQDGRSSSLTSPNGPAQSSLIDVAMQRAGCLGKDLIAVALHGTGQLTIIDDLR